MHRIEQEPSLSGSAIGQEAQGLIKSFRREHGHEFKQRLQPALSGKLGEAGELIERSRSVLLDGDGVDPRGTKRRHEVEKGRRIRDIHSRHDEKTLAKHEFHARPLQCLPGFPDKRGIFPQIPGGEAMRIVGDGRGRKADGGHSQLGREFDEGDRRHGQRRDEFNSKPIHVLLPSRFAGLCGWRGRRAWRALRRCGFDGWESRISAQSEHRDPRQKGDGYA